MDAVTAKQSDQGAVDPVTLEVIRNALPAISNEMSADLQRTSYNMMIYEVRDFCTGLVNPRGELVSQNVGGVSHFVADLGVIIEDGMKRYGEKGFKPGDVIISNHQAVAGQHLNNIVIYMPMFFEGELQMFTMVRAHWIDIGGMSLDLSILVDPLSVMMVLIITGVGMLIHVFSAEYMEHDRDYRRFFAEMNLFVFAMLLLVLAGMSVLGASLTLPGIAGLVLTVGMSVDSNVLIYERVREELRNGASPQAAINTGYERAFATILDSNITTLIAGLALLIFGSGPVRGFAVVHCLGILTSIFSSVVVSRALVNLIYGRQKKLTKVAIGQIWKGGCIIRARLLQRIQNAFTTNPNLPNLMVDPWFVEQIQRRIGGLRQVVAGAAQAGIPVPCFSSSLDYISSYGTGRLPQNLVQAMRDCFGSHTYERVDRAGSFHTEWLQ